MLMILSMNDPSNLFFFGLPRNIDAFQLDVPFFAGNIKPQYDWNFTSTAQIGLNNRTMPVFRGFILGGSSSVSKFHDVQLEMNSADLDDMSAIKDGMFYTRFVK